MADEHEIEKRCTALGIPGYMVGGIAKYVRHGVRPGDFLWSVLTNDLRGACMHADEQNQQLLFQYVSFLYWDAPYACWGSEEKAKAWIKHDGLSGYVIEG